MNENKQLIEITYKKNQNLTHKIKMKRKKSKQLKRKTTATTITAIHFFLIEAYGYGSCFKSYIEYTQCKCNDEMNATSIQRTLNPNDKQ